MIKGIFFDLCGTLLTYGDMDTAWEQWLEICYGCFTKSGLELSQERFSQACEGMFKLPPPPIENDGLTCYERRIKKLCREIGHSMSVTDLQNTASATVNSWRNHLQLDPDCPSVLSSLKEKYTLALISNYDHPPFIHSVLQQHQLKPYFSRVIISGEVGISKPDPRIFAMALRVTGLEASKVIYIGDNPEDDIQGSQNAGITPIFIQRDPNREMPATDYNKKSHGPSVNTKNASMPGVIIIRKLTELLDML
jgi:putative hydrolase of the HAD superfamily